MEEMDIIMRMKDEELEKIYWKAFRISCESPPIWLTIFKMIMHRHLRKLKRRKQIPYIMTNERFALACEDFRRCEDIFGPF